MRRIAAPFLVAPPSGARIRTRLRVSAADERVLRQVGAQLGRLAGQDLSRRCRIGPGDDQRSIRKQALTAACSSRWAGAITRTSNDQWERAYRNLLDARVGLGHAARKLRARLAVPAGERRGRTRGYGSRAERFEKRRRLQHLEARLAEVEGRIVKGRVSVCRGARRLAKHRHALDADDAALAKRQWRARWEAERLFLTADGEADKAWGNETIASTPTRAGWRSGCRRRWRICPTLRGGHRHTGYPARWCSPTVGTSGRRRPVAAPSGTTSAWIRPGARAAGTQAHPGASRQEGASAAGAAPASQPWRGPEHRSLGRLGPQPRRQPARPAGHDPPRARWPAGLNQGRQAPCRRRRTAAACHRARLPLANRREPRLRRRPPHRPGDPRPRHPRPAFPPHRLGHPDGSVPGSAGRHGRQRRAVDHCRRSRLDVGVGRPLLAAAPQQVNQAAGHGVAASCGGAGDRPAWARAPSPATGRVCPDLTGGWARESYRLRRAGHDHRRGRSRADGGA
jgi:hypothetical protein